METSLGPILAPGPSMTSLGWRPATLPECLFSNDAQESVCLVSAGVCFAVGGVCSMITVNSGMLDGNS